MKKIFLIFSLMFICFSPLQIAAQTQAEIPENIDEAKALGEKAVNVVQNQGWGILKNVWNNDAMPIWKNMFTWAKEHIWNNFLGPKLKSIWTNAVSIFKKEVEYRTPTSEQKINEEKTQIKEEAPTLIKSIWEKIRDFIK
jgi:hypothetical protein